VGPVVEVIDFRQPREGGSTPEAWDGQSGGFMQTGLVFPEFVPMAGLRSRLVAVDGTPHAGGQADVFEVTGSARIQVPEEEKQRLKHETLIRHVQPAGRRVIRGIQLPQHRRPGIGFRRSHHQGLGRGAGNAKPGRIDRGLSGLCPCATDGTSPVALVFCGCGGGQGPPRAPPVALVGAGPGLRLTRLGKCPDLSRFPYICQ
jgi:hypothetical protein